MYLDGGASGDICCLSPILKTITVCWLHDVELSFAASGFASALAHDSASYSTCAPLFPVIVSYLLEPPPGFMRIFLGNPCQQVHYQALHYVDLHYKIIGHDHGTVMAINFKTHMNQ
jgi:hypothetical protein